MKKYPVLRIAKILASCLFLLALASCGGGGGGPAPITGPGFVGLDDTATNTAPQLSVTYTDSSGTVTVNILSARSSDGDIAFDPSTNIYTVTQSPSEVFFGEDSSAADLPEYRAFLTFPLASSIPADATIDSATLEVYVDEADFADTIPTFVDMIQYPVGALSAADFDDPLVTSNSYRALDFYYSDSGNFVDIDVTGLMREALVPPAFADLQVRFGLQSLLAGLARGASVQAKRSVHSQPRSLGKIKSERNSAGRSTAGNSPDERRGAPVSNSE